MTETKFANSGIDHKIFLMLVRKRNTLRANLAKIQEFDKMLSFPVVSFGKMV